MPASGGMPAAVFAGNVSGVSWSGESIVFVATQGTSRIMRVPTRGGEAETLVALGQEEFADAPQLLPDGRTILFTLATGMNIDRWDSASDRRAAHRGAVVAGHGGAARGGCALCADRAPRCTRMPAS